MLELSELFINSIIVLRRWLHQHPELSYEEKGTTKFIKKTLLSWGIKFHRFNTIKSGGYADIGTGDSPILGFRADIDALPIMENPKHAIKSENTGVMHACGHDFHTSIGLGLLKYFSDYPEKLSGKLRVIFQPAEETTPTGALKVINEPIFDEMTGILGVHVDNRIQNGQVSIRKGAVCASSTKIEIILHGPGGHTSRPDDTVDLISVIAIYIRQLQKYLSKLFQSKYVLAFGQIHGGNYHNIIPSEISLVGTLRNFDNDELVQIMTAIKTYSKQFAGKYSLNIDVQFPSSTPTIINNDEMYRDIIAFSNQSGYKNRIKAAEPSMGADDFSFYQKMIPGLYIHIGSKGKGVPHSPDFELDDKLLKPAIEFLIEFIIFYLKKRK